MLACYLLKQKPRQPNEGYGHYLKQRERLRGSGGNKADSRRRKLTRLSPLKQLCSLICLRELKQALIADLSATANRWQIVPRRNTTYINADLPDSMEIGMEYHANRCVDKHPFCYGRYFRGDGKLSFFWFFIPSTQDINYYVDIAQIIIIWRE
jgi:hypothetical protein